MPVIAPDPPDAFFGFQYRLCEEEIDEIRKLVAAGDVSSLLAYIVQIGTASCEYMMRLALMEKGFLDNWADWSGIERSAPEPTILKITGDGDGREP